MHERRRSSPSTPPSPWSSEAHAPDAPTVVWETPRVADDVADDVADNDALDHLGAEPLGRSSVGQRAAIGAVVIAAALALVWLWPGGADDRGELTDELDDAPATTLGTLPPLDDSADEERSAEEPTRDSGERSTTLGDLTANARVGAGSAGGGGTTRPSAQQQTTIALPAALRDTEVPFEVVMTTPEGIATLTAPSGSLRTTPVELDDRRPMRVTVAPDVALVDSFDSAAIVDRTGRTTRLDVDPNDRSVTPVGWTEGTAGTEFVLQLRQPGDAPRLVGADTSGEVRELGPTRAGTTYLSDSGSRIVNDGDAVSRIEQDGASSIVAPGSMLGFGDNRILLQTCDDERSCTLGTLEVDTGERIPFRPDTSFELPSRVLSANDAVVSPDGTIAVMNDQPSGAPYPTTAIVRADGTSTLVAAPSGSGSLPSITWLPDSSGFLRVFGAGFRSIGSSVEFVATDGEVATIDGLPDGVTSLGVRRIDADLAASEITLGQIGAGAPADPGVALVGVNAGVAVHLDFRSQSVTPWATPSLGAAPLLVPVDDDLVAVSADGSTAFRTTLGAIQRHQRRVGGEPSALRFTGPTSALFWRLSDDRTAFELAPHPLAGQGDDPAVVVEVDEDDVLGTDGAGGLVFRRGGDVFVTDATTTRRVTTGELLSVGPDVALARECGERGQCANTLVTVDGARSILGGLPALAETPDRWPVPSGTVSPDGGVHLLRYPDAVPEWALVDIAETQILAVPDPDTDQPILWTEDSRYAFFLSDRVIHVFDRRLDSLTALTAVGEFDAITTVPLEFGA